jgi:hypothetical protein
VPDIGDIASLTIVCDNRGPRQTVTRHHFIVHTSLPWADWAPYMVDRWVDNCSEAYFLRKSFFFAGSSLRMDMVNPPTAETYEGSFGDFSRGEETGDEAPYQVGGLIYWKTDLAGRAFRGRTFLPGWMAADLNSLGPETAMYSAMNAYGAAMADAFFSDNLSAGGWLCVMSQQLNNEPRPFPVGTLVTEYQLSSKLYTYRPRAFPGF